MELNTIVLRGWAGSDVIFKDEPRSKPYARFRMAVSRSRRTDDGTWEEMESNWYTVKAWGSLARHVVLAVRKGNPVVVVGRPAAQAWKDKENRVFSALAIHAVTVGHDLGFGVSTYTRLDRGNEGNAPAAIPGVHPDTGVIEGDIEFGAEASGAVALEVAADNATDSRGNDSPGTGSDDGLRDDPPF